MFAPTVPGRRGLARGLLTTGLGGFAALALSMSPSLSGYAASATNWRNTAASTALAVAETNGAMTCTSYDATATCSSINKYGGDGTPLTPGSSQTTMVTFTNTGTVAVGTATLKAGTCEATARRGVTGGTTPTMPNTTDGNLCSVLHLAVYRGGATGTPVFRGSIAAFQAAAAVDVGGLPVGATRDYTFVLSLPATATSATQGQQIAHPIAWTFSQ